MHTFENYTTDMKAGVVIKPKILVSARFLYTPQQSQILRELVLTHDDELPDLPWLFDFVSSWPRKIDGKLKRVEWMWGLHRNCDYRSPTIELKH